MKEMELQMLAMSDAMTAKMKGMMTLLGAGVLIERRDHAHKLRYVAYKNWAHTIPMWRCSTCATDFNKTDKIELDSMSIQFKSYSLNDTIWIKASQVIKQDI